MAITLDDYDKKIIKYLQEDASISNIDLSKKIGLAPSSCLLRVKNLKEQKVIKQYTAMVDERILGYDITCFAKVAMQPLNRETSSNFIAEVKIVAKSFQYYRDFIFDKLLSIAAVSNVETSIVVATEKKTNLMPLD